VRILIAEDDAVSRRLLQRTLEKWGHEVLAACDGKEAWKLFQEEDISFVVTDWMMPEMSGTELVRRIRGTKPRGYVYLILLTAKSQREDLIEGMEAGADDFVTKPFDKDELRVRIAAGQRVVDLETALARQNEHMRRDLQAAAAVQMCLLPQSPPEVAGYDFAWEFIPSEFVAGDIFNIHRLDENRLAIYIIDVSGHGVPSAMLSVTLSRALEPVPGDGSILKRRIPTPPHYEIASPSEVLAALNSRFPMDSNNGLYHTAICGVLDIRDRRLTLSRAGHPHPIITRDGRGDLFKCNGGVPVGMLAGVEYPEDVCALKSGDRFFLYSDGLIEAMTPSGQILGAERLADALAQSHDLPLSEGITNAMNILRADMDQSGFDDDITLVGLEVK
jgi:sigma-B regulation protein RsbU (phosphoserine phosphatase)